MLYVISKIGRYTIDQIKSIGRITIFTTNSIRSLFSKQIYLNVFWKRVFEFSFLPISTVGLVSLFIGAALVMQFKNSPYYSTSTSLLVAPIVSSSIIRELGPTLIALIMSGRIGSSYAAEIATMKITEQIDALRTLQTESFSYLFITRIMAGIISMPILAIASIVIGIYGGYLAATTELNITSADYMYSTFASITLSDLKVGLTKSLVFGFVISLMGCYHGYYCTEGERGVGAAATSSVLSSSILIILLNYIISLLYGI